MSTPNVQSNYLSALTQSSQLYSFDSSTIANRYYEVIQLAVSKSGCYHFIIKSYMHIIAYIYNNTFNALDLNSDLLAYHNGNETNTQIYFTLQLNITTTYMLVISTYFPTMIGNFSIHVYGPDQVHMNATSKQFFHLIVLPKTDRYSILFF